MAVLPSELELLSSIRFIAQREPVSSQVTNRPVQDLVAALAASGGIFSQIEDLVAFSAIHKPNHTTNDTALLVHYDNGTSSAINDVVAQGVPGGLTTNYPLSKFFGSLDMGGNQNNAVAPGNSFLYEDLNTSYEDLGGGDARGQGTLSFWVNPYSLGGVHQVWNWFSANGSVPPFNEFPLVRIQRIPGSSPTDNYIEVGFNSEFEYWYAKFVGPSTSITLKGANNTFPVATEFSDKWYNVVVTWDLDNSAALIEDQIFDINLYVNGDLLDTNFPIGNLSRFEEVINFDAANIRVRTGNWLIDELRYDIVSALDTEVFAWYESDVPFVHPVEAINPKEFGHKNAQQLIKTILSGAASGNFIKNYFYYGENDTVTIGSEEVSVAGLSKRIEFIQTSGNPAWVAECDYVYDLDQFLSQTIFTIQANNNGSSIIKVTETHRYNTSAYTGDLRFVTPMVTLNEPVYNGDFFSNGFMQDTEVKTEIL